MELNVNVQITIGPLLVYMLFWGVISNAFIYVYIYVLYMYMLRFALLPQFSNKYFSKF